MPKNVHICSNEDIYWQNINSRMKQIVRLTESDIHRIVKQVISEAIDEHDMGLVGAYSAAQENLKNKRRLGYNSRIRPNGKIEDNKKRLIVAKQNLTKMINQKFVETFGTNGTLLECMCWYYKTSAYEFTFHMKGIEQINTHDFSIIGDIVDIDKDGLAPSLEHALIPSQRTNVVLVYNLANRTISFTRKKNGLTIKPFDGNNNSWGNLLKLIGLYNAGFMKFAR